MNSLAAPSDGFIPTAMSCAVEACITARRQDGAVVLCLREFGCGVTTAAIRATHWDVIGDKLTGIGSQGIPPRLLEAQTVFMPTASPRSASQSLRELHAHMCSFNGLVIRSSLDAPCQMLYRGDGRSWVRVIVVDDAHFWHPFALRRLCQETRRLGIGVVLIVPLALEADASLAAALAGWQIVRVRLPHPTASELRLYLECLDAAGPLWPGAQHPTPPGVLDRIAFATRTFTGVHRLVYKLAWLTAMCATPTTTSSLLEVALRQELE